MRVTVRVLKSRLSEHLRKAAAGEEIVVTSRGKEVARLVPPRVRPRTSTEAEAIARFRSLPWVRQGSSEKPALPKPLIRIGKNEKALAEIVSEQRR